MNDELSNFRTRLAQRPDRDRVRLRLGTVFIEHVDDLWPEGEPGATPEWIRANVDDILLLLEQMIGSDGQGVRRLPRRLHWVLWLLPELFQTLDQPAPFGG